MITVASDSVISIFLTPKIAISITDFGALSGRVIKIF